MTICCLETDLPVVLHLIRPEPADSVGGADLHVLDLAVAQEATGRWAPVVVALGAPRPFRHRACSLGVGVHDPICGSPRGLGSRLAAFAQQHRAVLVHAHGYEADYLAALLHHLHPAFRRLPLVMTCHGLVRGRLRHRVMSWFDVRSMRAAHALVCVAEDAAKDLRRELPTTPVYVVANGVPPPPGTPDLAVVQRVRAELGAGPGEPLVAFVGRLSPEKRPDLFIAAACGLTRRLPAARFAVIGGGTLAETTRRLVRAAGLTDRCVVAGVRHDMEAVYSAIDVLLLCSDTEGTPRVVLEAQARRVPVIARAVGDVPRLIRDGQSGLLVSGSNPAALADAACRLLSDSALHEAVVEAAAAEVRQQYTAHHMAAEINRIYADLLVVRRSPHLQSRSTNRI